MSHIMILTLHKNTLYFTKTREYTPIDVNQSLERPHPVPKPLQILPCIPTLLQQLTRLDPTSLGRSPHVSNQISFFLDTLPSTPSNSLL
jgi:hypothetical protein